jgi:serine/threonine protein kinase
MDPTSTCPEGAVLRRLALGQLSDQEAAPLEEHLAQCGRCAETLQALQLRDTLVQGLQTARTTPAPPEWGQVEGLIQRLQGLPPLPGDPEKDTATAVPGGTEAGPEGPSWRLGEYRLLREVGRGGMGIVYEAEQPSLGRHVALKVLPARALLAPEHLERFRREARAAALLHHSNIVPVFGVGCDGGVHFYAMQFIHGQSLDRVLRELRRARGEADAGPPDPVSDLSASLAEGLRTGRFSGGAAGAGGAPGPAPPSPAEPTGGGGAGGDTAPSGLTGLKEGEYYRGVAGVGVQVAEALAYAHRQGILHRDIKPSNLLLDARGTVWVTDFGLARAEGLEELTQTGDVVGTLRYLAPERFGGRSDPRGDVYSLGAALYELLTLRPAFDEPDRVRLIDRVTHGEPPRPRQVDGRIPRDLETIVLKAMAREPADRYQTAEALAEDLRRFLLDRPIRARRASMPERTWRWCRRNPIVAGLLAAAVVLATGLAVLALLLWDRQQQTAAALKQADEQRQEAERRRLLAEANFQRACVLLHNAPLKQQFEWLLSEGPPSGAEIVAQQKALTLFQGLLTEPGADPGDRLLTAEVYRELADIHVSIGRPTEAIQEYQKAIVLLRQLVQEFPQEAGFRDSLAYCSRQTGWMKLLDPAGLQEGESAFDQAISLYEGLRHEFRDVPWYRLQLAICWNDQGELRRRNGRFPQAEESLRRALALRQQLFDEFPLRSEQRGPLAKSHNDLAWVLAIRPDWQPHHAAEALEHARKAVALEPGYHDWWHTLGVAHCRLGHWKEALECIEKSRQLEQQQPGSEPGPPGSWERFFEAMAYSGLGDKENARRCYDQGVQWMQEHAADHPDLRRFRDEAAQMLGITGSP